MNEQEQAAGEKRVQEMLIKPLEDLGLRRPGGLTVGKWETVKHEIRKKLAYMGEDSLRELREWIEANPAGDGDRFPPALRILRRAASAQKPNVGPAAIVLKVFRSEMAVAAIEKGWAPELLAYVSGNYEWPGRWTVSKIMEAADDKIRRLDDIELRLSRRDYVSPEDVAFRNERLTALQKCRDVAAEARAQRVPS